MTFLIELTSHTHAIARAILIIAIMEISDPAGSGVKRRAWGSDGGRIRRPPSPSVIPVGDPMYE